jgi:rhodanese-related sulfurtransferase
MPKSVKEMMAHANKLVERVSVQQARALVAEDNAIVVDIRDGTEVNRDGKAKGALHISRSMLEFHADSEMPMHNPDMRKDRPVILYCGSGGRASLAGVTLLEMGYSRVYNMGGFKSWVEEGGEVE